MRLFLFSVAATFCCFLPLLFAQEPVVAVTLHNPDTSVKFAAADILQVPQEERQYIRYLSLYNIPKDQRAMYGRIISFMVHSLGTRRQPYIPLFVGGSDQTVIRLNIDNYEWSAEIWDKLARNGSGPKAQPEPYFHSFIDKISTKIITKKVLKEVPVTRKEFVGYSGNVPQYRNITVYEKRWVDEQVKQGGSTKRTFAAAAWVDPTAIASLITETQAESPILRADWFLTNACVPPAYYDFLRLGKDIKDFHNLVFTDIELAKKSRTQDKGIVVLSGITRNNRTLLRSPAFTGYYWESHDTLKSVDDRQYVRNILDERFDATEDIGTLPNGLQAYFLTDGKGKRLDVANPDIAIDNTAVDRQVRSGRSCMICHSDGIRHIDDEIRSLTKKLTDPNQIKLLIVKREDARRIEDLFGSNLDEQIITDQNSYAKAVARVNGLKTSENAKYFSKFYDEYAEVVLTREVVARELGVPEADLDIYLKLSTDPVVLGLLRTPIRAVRRDQWEESFQEIMLIVRLLAPAVILPQIFVPKAK